MIDNNREEALGQISTSSRTLNKPLRRLVWLVVAVLYLGIGLFILTFDTLLPVGDQIRFEVEDIPDQDIFAPETRVYESTVLTDQARQEAANSVEPRYDRLLNVAREQIDLMRDIVDYMTLVQNDPYATREQKIRDLEAIASLENVNTDTWEQILEVRPARWSIVTEEMINALQRTMRLDIHPDGVEEARRSLANTVDPNLSDTEQRIIINVVRELIVPNNILNEEETQAARESAMNAVQPRFRTVEAGEAVITKGRRVTAVDIEALRQLGLLETRPSNARVFISALLMLITVSSAQLFYLVRFYPNVFASTTLLTVLAVLFLVFLIGARLFGPEGFDQQRLYPAAALGLLVTALVGPHLATITLAGLALLVGTMYDNPLELMILITVGGMSGVWGLRDIERLNSYFTAGFIIGVVNMIITTAFMINNPSSPQIITYFSENLLALSSGLLSAGLALVGLFVVGAVANLTTSVKLIELMQPNQPLLQLLLRKAPGTYQHSLQVANLAELAAERIGANATLVRVAAMYHDIGKTLNPQFFVENQAGDVNPHDELDDPYRSAQLIIGHVLEGERLARRYRLPQRIRDFIREHHGTMRPLYFYYRALERVDGDDQKIDSKEFTYPGPVPQSRETAILLLADGTESTARAVSPRTYDAIEEVVNQTFERALEDGQLDESSLTLNDLKAIREVFIDTLQGIYHQRIEYRKPELKAEHKPPPQLSEGPASAEDAPVPEVAGDEAGQAAQQDGVPAPQTAPMTDTPPAQAVLPDEEATPPPAESETVTEGESDEPRQA